MGLHSDPAFLTRDDFSGDFGIGFYGHWKNAGSYLSCTDDVGWLCLSCDVVALRTATATKAAVPPCAEAVSLDIVPRDAFRRTLYLQPLGLKLTLDGAAVAHASLKLQGARSARLTLVPVPSISTHAMLTIVIDASATQRHVRLQCAAPCGFTPTPFAGRADGMYRLRFGSAAGAELVVELLEAGFAV
mmetsp:Transcript_43226/g.97660  ORF Transcript_43226/g.97660 Transcript_43226/m.97660 type:complete len:188 (-) Transcript_43226:737-1300(-)